MSILIAHECFWMLMRAYEYPWVMGADELYPVLKCLIHYLLNQKCQLFKRVPCSILTISWSKFNQIKKSLTFLKSTWKGLLKNVQDEISRPLGSREIQKTKALPVLRDTLYYTWDMSMNNYSLMRKCFPIRFPIWKLAFDPNLGHCPKFEICNWPNFGAKTQISAIPDWWRHSRNRWDGNKQS